MAMHIDGYSDLVQVGKGGFAVVYRARQDRFNRVVAMKVLTVEELDDRDRQRFERECSAMGNLSWHPNVVAIFDSGIAADGHPYLTMEYLDAGTLADRILSSGPLSWEEAVSTGIQIAGALGAAHEAGTLHRDLKPENLLVGPFGEVKLGDFGIAAIEGSARTTMGQSAYTIAHVAPEVLRGEQPDARTDIYGLASTIFTLIDGMPPFVGSRDEPMAALITKVLHHEPPGLTGVPEALDALLRQAMDKDREQRPPDAESFGRALQEIQIVADQAVTVLRLTPTASTSESSPSAPLAGASVSGRRTTPPRGDASVTIAPGDPRSTDIPPIGRTAPEVPPVPPPVPTVGDADPESAPDRDSRTADRSRRRGLLVAGGVVGAVALVAGIVFLAGDNEGSPSTAAAPAEDTADAEVTATIAVGTTPLGIDATDDAVWVANSEDATVSRIDPSTDEVAATIGVGVNPVDVAATNGAVWVVNNGSASLTRIDPATDEVVATIDVGEQPFGLAATGEAVWVSSDATPSVTRVDPATNEVVAVIPVDDNPFALAATNTTVWVTSDPGAGVGQSEQGTVTAIDVATNERGAVVVIGKDLGAVAATDTMVWVAQSEIDELTRFDPRSPIDNEVVSVGSAPNGIAISGEQVWVTNVDDRTASLIDAATNEVIATVLVGAEPIGIAARGDTAWVTNGSDGTVSRIDRSA